MKCSTKGRHSCVRCSLPATHHNGKFRKITCQFRAILSHVHATELVDDPHSEC
jgi:hypothetical protein